tara:strand:- start:30 stop:839 length:810 start_codon:yes stop_codon:yes gene_type:complete
MKTKEIHFDSISALVNRALAPMPEEFTGRAQESRSTGAEAEKFTGTSTFQEACRLATEGWSAGRKRLLESQREIEFAGSCKSLEPEFFFDVAGDEPEVARFLEGEPENMMEYQFDYTDKQANKVQKITLDICTGAGTSADRFPRVGACMLMIADALESAGYRVEIDLSMISDSKGLKIDVLARMKEADQPLDLNSLAFWSMHPSALRRFEFALYERECPQEFYCHSYGGSVKTKPKHEGEIVVSIADPQFGSDRDAWTYCNEVLARFND